MCMHVLVSGLAWLTHSQQANTVMPCDHTWIGQLHIRDDAKCMYVIYYCYHAASL